jgi:hypothetical protein
LRRTFVAELLTLPRTSFGNGKVHRFDSHCDIFDLRRNLRTVSSERRLTGANMVRPAMGGAAFQSCKSNLLNGSGERASARLLRYISLPFSIGADSRRAAAGARTPASSHPRNIGWGRTALGGRTPTPHIGPSFGRCNYNNRRLQRCRGACKRDNPDHRSERGRPLLLK